MPLIVRFLICLSLGGAQAQSPPSDLAKLAASYDLQISTSDLHFPVETAHGQIDGTPATEADLLAYTRLFVPEFSLYPTDLIRRSRLQRIVLCTDLAFAGQRRNAIPDFEHDTLYLDVRRGSHNPAYLRKVIHHEFFHIVDYLDDGSLYQDPNWAALNPPDFRYGDGGRNAQDLKETSVLTDRFPGFLNHYSTTAVEEDKAELFANLLVDPDHVERRAADDPVLDSKVDRLHALLLQFCPSLDDAFWNRVRDLPRP